MNLILMTDSYKAGHAKCYPKGIHKVYSYLESRGGEFPSTLFFGLQYYLHKYLSGVRVTRKDVDEAEIFWGAHFGRTDYFDRQKWDHIVDAHGGTLPIRILAVPEGMVVPTKNVLMTIENTDPACYWLVNFLETLLMKLWYPITVATQSYHIRQGIELALAKTGTPSGISFKCHDFGYRGVAAEEMAEIGGAAHLISFLGTDTVAGIRMLQQYYGAAMCGFSIPATEHSIMCAGGRDGEADVMDHLLKSFPSGLIACVSDTYDIERACSEIWGGQLKDKVLARDGALVVRPDSGDYFQVVPRVLEILYEKFGGKVNGKGKKVLHDKVRVIQGDGMDRRSILALYQHLDDHGWSADNLAVGSGGGLLQKLDRDTLKMAIKASAMEVGGIWKDVYKDPKTDPGKTSKRGRFQVVRRLDGRIETVPYGAPILSGQDILLPVFENGKILRELSLEAIKKNAGTL